MENDLMNIVKLAVDAYNGTVNKYSTADAEETVRQALIQLNGGSTKLNYKAIRDGKCSGLFTIIEEVLSQTIVGGLKD